MTNFVRNDHDPTPREPSLADLMRSWIATLRKRNETRMPDDVYYPTVMDDVADRMEAQLSRVGGVETVAALEAEAEQRQ